MEFNKDTPKISIRLSKSGKAVLIYDEEGYCYMTSVAYMMMLLQGSARNNMIAARRMGGEATSNFQNDDKWDSSKIRKVDGNPLSANADKQREQGRVKVQGDW